MQEAKEYSVRQNLETSSDLVYESLTFSLSNKYIALLSCHKIIYKCKP